VSNASVCVLWKRAEPKSGTHTHGRDDKSDWDPGTGTSTSGSCGRFPKQRANGLNDSGACSRNGSMGTKGSSRRWPRPGEKRPRRERKGNTPREGEGERWGEPVSEGVRVCEPTLFLRSCEALRECPGLCLYTPSWRRRSCTVSCARATKELSVPARVLGRTGSLAVGNGRSPVG